MNEYIRPNQPTPLNIIYDRFFGKITEDMWHCAEWTEEDTKKDLNNIFLDALPGFEFPRFPLFDFDLEQGLFNVYLTIEEINILAVLMLNAWLQRQITSIENIRQKYTGAEFCPLIKKFMS